MNIVFRVDSTETLGLGHLMRCLALSEELTKSGNICYFLSKIDGEDFIQKIKKIRGIYVKPETGTSLQEDLRVLIRFSKQHEANWIVTDHYNINSEYVKEIKRNGFSVLSIDDTAQMYYFSDIVLNQNIGAEKLIFTAETYTKFLLGPKYVLLREELLKRNKKKMNNQVKKILITLGGYDHSDLTIKILQSLNELNIDAEIGVIVGPYNLYHDHIQKYISESKMDCQIIFSPENMLNFYLDSDIAISAGGSSCYELAYFGIPNIIITIADNQLNIARELHSQMISMYLGSELNVKRKNIEDALRELLDTHMLRKTLSENGKHLIDGKGKKRIVDFLENCK